MTKIVYDHSLCHPQDPLYSSGGFRRIDESGNSSMIYCSWNKRNKDFSIEKFTSIDWASVGRGSFQKSTDEEIKMINEMISNGLKEITLS